MGKNQGTKRRGGITYKFIVHSNYIMNNTARKFFLHPLFWMVVMLRLGAAFYLLINPLWGFILGLVFDYFDHYVWVYLLKMTQNHYHYIDKILDTTGYFCISIIGTLKGYMFVFELALIFRLIGNFFWLKTGNKKFLIFFPNLLEVAFVWFVLLNMLGLTYKSIANWFVFALLVDVQIVREIYIHDISTKLREKLGVSNSWEFLAQKLNKLTG